MDKKTKIFLDNFFPYTLSGFNCKNIEFIESVLPFYIPKYLEKTYQYFSLYIKSYEDGIILSSRRITLLLGLLYFIYKPSGTALIGYEFILNYKSNLRSKISLFFWRIAIKKVDKIIVHTSNERKYLSEILKTSQEKFKTIHFYTDNKDYIGPTRDGYIFSAGKMERDFITLMDAVRDTDLKLVIVANESLREILERNSNNKVQLFFDISKTKYEELLKKSRLVIVPLKKGMDSRGQCVTLESMRYGKPVICSKINGIIEYIKDGYNGFLVEPENSSKLRELIIKTFNDEKKLNEIGKNAFEVQRSEFYFEKFCTEYIETLFEVRNSIYKIDRNSCTSCSNNLCSYNEINSYS